MPVIDAFPSYNEDERDRFMAVDIASDEKMRPGGPMAISLQ